MSTTTVGPTREAEEQARGVFLSAFCDNILRDCDALACGSRELEVTTTYLQLLARAIESTPQQQPPPTAARASSKRLSYSPSRRPSASPGPPAARVASAARAAGRVVRLHVRHDGVSRMFRGEVNVTGVFPGVRHLRLTRVKPSSVADLRDLSLDLVTLKVTEAVCSVRELLDVVGEEQEGWVERMRSEGCWAQLEGLSIEGNFVPVMDESLRTLPKCAKLNFGGNLVRKVENLQEMYDLTWLDLTYNKLASLESCALNVGNVRCLLLRGNSIRSTRGLERLYGLEDLDLGENRIEDLAEVARLAGLPLLHGLWLDDNPIVAANGERYRKRVLCSMAERLRDPAVGFSLDGELASHEEVTDALSNPLFVTSVAIKKPEQRTSHPGSPASPSAVNTSARSSGVSSSPAGESSSEGPESERPTPPAVAASVQVRKKRRKKAAPVGMRGAGAVAPLCGPAADSDCERLSKSLAAETSDQWREKLEGIRSMAGDKWLLVVDELRPQEPDKTTTRDNSAVPIQEDRLAATPEPTAEKNVRTVSEVPSSPVRQVERPHETETGPSPSPYEAQPPRSASSTLSSSPHPSLPSSGTSVPARIYKQQQSAAAAVLGVPSIVRANATNPPPLPEQYPFAPGTSLPAIPPKPQSPPPSPLHRKTPSLQFPPKPTATAPVAPLTQGRVARKQPSASHVDSSPSPQPLPAQQPEDLPPPLAALPACRTPVTPRRAESFAAQFLIGSRITRCTVILDDSSLVVSDSSTNQHFMMSNVQDLCALTKDSADPTVIRFAFSPRGVPLAATSDKVVTCSLKLDDVPSADRFYRSMEPFLPVVRH